jgi:hypothetical protein
MADIANLALVKSIWCSFDVDAHLICVGMYYVIT